MSRVHEALAPYVRHLCQQAVDTGLPLQRALFVQWEDDAVCREVETQFAYGSELVVAPVLRPDTTEWECALPAGVDWVHLWTGRRHAGGRLTVAAPLGQPPVFYDAAGDHAALFAAVAERFASAP